MINKEIMEKCLISVTEQLAIIKKARELFATIETHKDFFSFNGLCVILKKCIINLSDEESWFEGVVSEESIHIQDYLPMFTYDNAKQCGAIDCKSEYEYWWKICPYDYKNRLKFLDWMEEDILK